MSNLLYNILKISGGKMPQMPPWLRACDVDFSAKERVTLLSGHPNGDTQLLNLETVSFLTLKRRRINV